jgi:hypothetical protein
MQPVENLFVNQSERVMDFFALAPAKNVSG